MSQKRLRHRPRASGGFVSVGLSKLIRQPVEGSQQIAKKIDCLVGADKANAARLDTRLIGVAQRSR